ncbi:MAG: lipase family alpha/beta hydrolase [Acidimicrobiia bacterium]
MIEARPAQNVGSAVAFAVDRVVAPVEAMHRVIAGNWFDPFGPAGAPIRKAHAVMARLAYGSVRLGADVAGFGFDQLSTVEPGTADSIQAFVNGLWGDDLGRYEDRLEITMTVRDRGGTPVTVGPDLAVAFPAATGRLVVLVHGLVETERCWSGSETEPGLAQALENVVGLTSISIRYNSGLRVSDNGALLSSLLEEISSDWPVPVESIAFVGHSMGGLVIRSACEAAHAAGHGWIGDVDDIVTVGTPHQGSPLEKFANAAAWGLGVTPVTVPLAEFVNRRSVGIKDLRFGAIVEDDWIGVDPDALLRDTVGGHTLPPGIDHHFVAAVVTSDPTHPLGVAVGDLVVRPGSGTGGHNLEPRNVVLVGGKHHFGLLHERMVIDSVLDWLAPTPALRSTVQG